VLQGRGGARPAFAFPSARLLTARSLAQWAVKPGCGCLALRRGPLAPGQAARLAAGDQPLGVGPPRRPYPRPLGPGGWRAACWIRRRDRRRPRAGRTAAPPADTPHGRPPLRPLDEHASPAAPYRCRRARRGAAWLGHTPATRQRGRRGGGGEGGGGQRCRRPADMGAGEGCQGGGKGEGHSGRCTCSRMRTGAGSRGWRKLRAGRGPAAGPPGRPAAPRCPLAACWGRGIDRGGAMERSAWPLKQVRGVGRGALRQRGAGGPRRHAPSQDRGGSAGAVAAGARGVGCVLGKESVIAGAGGAVQSARYYSGSRAPRRALAAPRTGAAGRGRRGARSRWSPTAACTTLRAGARLGGPARAGRCAQARGCAPAGGARPRSCG
jgi:hypothetical protein